MSNSVASLSVQQLQDMITSTIRAKYGGPYRNNLMYSKLYTKRIDNMRMPAGYQPPKFQQFDWKGNPKQHVAHFVETCNNAGTEGDLIVKQFVRSLKGNALDWYTDIEPESIDCWEAMEHEFLNRFYSMRCSVSMMELTNTRQWKDEPVVDYINRWRSLSLDCKERLSEISAVEMCMQGMHWGLLYILQGNRPASFKELATRAHDMEISIANHGGNSPALPDPCKERKEGKKVERSSKMTGKESLVVTTAPLKVPKKDNYKEAKAPEHLREKPRQQPSLKELEGKVYPFPDSDVPGILDFLLEKRVIELPDSKCPEESGLPEDIRHKTKIRRRAPRFIYYKDTLLRHSYEGLFLHCLGEEEAAQDMDEAHSGVCGAHQSGPKLHFRIKRMGYYWPTMIPSLRIAIQEGLKSEDNARLRLEELEALDEKRLEVQQRLECYQARLSKAFNKRVRPRSFTVDDLVLAVRRLIIITHRTGNKFTSKWDGPYVSTSNVSEANALNSAFLEGPSNCKKAKSPEDDNNAQKEASQRFLEAGINLKLLREDIHQKLGECLGRVTPTCVIDVGLRISNGKWEFARRCGYHVGCGIGFEPLSSEYKVIRIAELHEDDGSWGYKFHIVHVEIYNLSTDSWREVDAVVPSVWYFPCSELLLNGAFHWWENDEEHGTESTLSFHISTETCFVIWLMTEYGIAESWTKQFTIRPFVQVEQPLSYFWKKPMAIWYRTTSNLKD
ncbi:hypothetical protein RJ639_010563 [Escallonia herrerae]|uniref:Retrotransposon gag domain-containing protein n=1 Tax=Escallonia herrerae TaxID=1293975 RepID=A0AA88VQW3_9ASTE|nr:hypothetical protein RJ639_010563 [Escallonia herrerae]